ncbi:polysaccharide deacetylase family protein [Nonomuraea phyllanthi]|uniref:Polysaccharide deacetylase family protein n=1 Tax=Nonomuraea phyllanthi TaxID=2219224 RepID=A0A5C4WHD9_9ACTN|nr:polysaccharide deacetylase family protein [Nonomuraea phyllanthi]
MPPKWCACENTRRGEEEGPVRRVLMVAIAVAALTGGCGGQDVPPSPRPSQTGATPAAGGVVSLTFDDGLERQEQMARELTERGMAGTFYVLSTRVQAPGYLDQTQLARLAQAGHEIGGHTRTHARLPTLHHDEQRREICGDRSALEAMGFTPRSFAFPFHAVNAAAEAVAEECGYNSARGRAGVAAETTPPGDPYDLNTPLAVGANATLPEIQQYVLAAEKRKGWAILVFHDYCDGCGPLGVKPTLFTAFLDWLKGQKIPVRTVGDVIGGETRPVPPVKAPSIVLNASLENYFGKEGIPDCWQLDGRSATATFGRVADARTGRWAGRIKVTGGDPARLRLAIRQDDGECAPTAGGLSVWYTATAPVRLTLSRRTRDGVWSDWSDGPVFPATSTWRRATWTPRLAGAAGISFGLVLTEPGQATFDDFAVR